MNRNKLVVFSGFKFAFIEFTFLMLSFCLLIDSINGYFLSGMGVDLQLSAAYKLLLLLFIGFQIGSYSTKTFVSLLSTMLLLMIGPVINLTRSLDILGFILDFTTALKLLTPIFVFCYIALLAQKRPFLVFKYGNRVCLISFIILMINLILGVLGFGFASYGNSEVGVKGFFFAGNEVSGLFIVFFGFMLHQIWQRKKIFKYFLMSILTMVCGIMIATKAAMLSGVILVLLIPYFNDRNRLLNLTWTKLKLISPILFLIIIAFFFLVPILESTGIWGRMVWFYEKKGFLGLIFSGRDRFVASGIESYNHVGSLSDFIFGIGRSGLGNITKDSMEIDPIDMFFWFGFLGAFIYVMIIVVFLRLSYLAAINKSSLIAPCVLLINLLLILVSIVAGHIFTSGMLGPFIGLINGMAFADLYKRNLNKNVGQSVSNKFLPKTTLLKS